MIGISDSTNWGLNERRPTQSDPDAHVACWRVRMFRVAFVLDRAKWLSSGGLMFDLAGIVQLEISGLFEHILTKYGDEQKYPMVRRLTLRVESSTIRTHQFVTTCTIHYSWI